MDPSKGELRILMLEDAPSDAELMELALLDAGLAFSAKRVDRRETFEQALDDFKPDIVLSDCNLPSYTGREALLYVQHTHPYIPVIMVTGAMGDESAVEMLKLGARDYVLKDRLARLVPAIQRALKEEYGIRQRELAQEALRRANRALKTLSAGNLALVRAQNEDELLHAVTNVLVDLGGYCLAVVHYAADDPQAGVVPMAWAGKDDGLRRAQPLSRMEAEQSQWPVAVAMRDATTQVGHDPGGSGFTSQTGASDAPCCASSMAIPLLSQGKVLGALSLYSSDAKAFDEEEVRLMEELANDLVYGIVNLRTRMEREQQAALLRQSLEQSIQTIAATVEARDPYTAGHQRRVVGLATAIAREMGLPQERISGLHLAASIHDLGKLHIPAEILSKPGRLTDVEYMLIKEHPRAGYDILKDVTFPWPIAQMILQHHERLDGSGYPQGLKAEQILLESKIMAVADVVEAISSHRPYRPSLGVEAALEEISRNRGVRYDPAAVDACVKLFHELGYKWPA